MRIAELAVPGGLAGGPFGSSLGAKDYVPSGIPVIRGVNLGSTGKFHTGDFVFVTQEKVHNELSRNTAIPGDVVFTQRGTLGQVGIVPAGPFRLYVISQSQMRLRVDRRVALADFIYYQFKSPAMVSTIHNRAITTGVPHINLGILADLEIALPHVDEQRAICEVLGALDDKIAANGRASRVLVDISDAFALDLLNRSSKTVKLGALIDLKYGKALKASVRRSGHVPVFGGNGISGYHDIALVEGPGVVVGRKGANAGSVSWADRDFWPIDTAFYVSALSNEIPLEFLYHLMKSAGLRNHVGDSAIPGLNRDIALSVDVRLPDFDSIKQFSRLARSHLLLDARLRDESERLARLRDLLLPKLMSGDIRVRDVKKVVEEAV